MLCFSHWACTLNTTVVQPKLIWFCRYWAAGDCDKLIYHSFVVSLKNDILESYYSGEFHFAKKIHWIPSIIFPSKSPLHKWVGQWCELQLVWLVETYQPQGSNCRSFLFLIPFLILLSSCVFFACLLVSHFPLVGLSLLLSPVIQSFWG